MNEKEYLERLDSLIQWFSGKGSLNRKYYITYQKYESAVNYAIPSFIFASMMLKVEALRAGNLDLQCLIIAFGLSLGSIFLNSYIKKMRFQEISQKYLKLLTILEKEKMLFVTKSSPYDNEKAFNLLVENTEEIVASHSEINC